MTNGTAPKPKPGKAIIQPIDDKNVEVRRDYVAGSSNLAWYRDAVQALPWSIDSLTAELGTDLYSRMLHDPTVASSVNALRAGILENGAEFVASVTDEQDDGYAKAQEIAAFCTSVMDDLEMPLDDVLWDMLSAVALGNRVAEVVYGLVAGKLVTTSIKVKPHQSTAFVVDPYMNVIGLLGLIPGTSWSVQVGTYLTDIANTPNLLPRDKFAILSYRPHDNDPRGTSVLRPSYNAWHLKQIAWPEYLKYLVQFASASLVGYTAENAATDFDGVDPETRMVNTMMTWRNGGVMALRFGSKVDILKSQGDGKAFLDAFQHFDRQIIHGILNQTLATMEGIHQTRAASQTHQDVMDTLIRQGKQSVQRMIQRDILRPLVRMNYGDTALELLPHVTLGNVSNTDFSVTATAIAQLMTAGYFDPSQLPAIDEQLGIEVRKAPDPAAATPADASTPPAQQQGQPPQPTPPQDAMKGGPGM